MALVLPSKQLQQTELETVFLPDIDLYRVSGYNTGEPHFGITGGNRFDDNSRPKSKRYGVCYCGLDLETGIAETLLHDELPQNGTFHLSAEAFRAKKLIEVRASDLNLVVMTGIQLKRLAGGGELSTVVPYSVPQAWSRALHAHPQNFDGILYQSRHLNDRPAVALFDRAKNKLSKPTISQLVSAPNILQIVMDLHISLTY